MAHYCICPKCGVKFNRDKIQAVRVGAKRYGHSSCYPDNKDFVEMPQKDPDLVALEDYIGQLFGADCNWAMVKRQIKEYVEDRGFQYSGILGTLVYWYDVKKNSTKKSNGSIGIVPFVYNDASKYYANLNLANQNNLGKELKDYIPKERVIEIQSPRTTVRQNIRFFNLEDD